MIVKDYVNDFCEIREMQFAAVTIKLKGNLSYVSFRGTDNTLVGWKEDFNMSFTCPVPSQLKAVDYVNRIARKVRGKIILGGHSKGGNLAVYSAAFCKKRIQKRILSVYSFDGPGFNQETLNKPEYERISLRTTTYVPQSSVIGMLLGHEEKYIIIQSDEKGLAQHDVYTWQLADKKFIELSTVDDKSRFIDKTLKKWLLDMSVDERKVFVDTIYEVLVTTQAKTLKELKQSAWKNLKIIHNSFKGLDDKTKKTLQTGFRYLIQSAKEEALTAINNKKKKDASSKRKRDKFLFFSNKEKKEQITSNKRSR